MEHKDILNYVDSKIDTYMEKHIEQYHSTTEKSCYTRCCVNCWNKGCILRIPNPKMAGKCEYYSVTPPIKESTTQLDVDEEFLRDIINHHNFKPSYICSVGSMQTTDLSALLKEILKHFTRKDKRK